MMIISVLLVALITCLVRSLAEQPESPVAARIAPPVHNPGAKVRLSQSGLEYASDVAVDVLSERVYDIDIPNQSGHWLHCSYSVTDMRVG